MAKKFYYLTLDTETAGTQDDPIIYDLGGCVHDRHGNIVERFSFVITEVFSDKNLMATAYYCDKIPMYLKGMNKEWVPVHWYEARKYIFNLLDKYNIKYDEKMLSINPIVEEFDITKEDAEKRGSTHDCYVVTAKIEWEE